MSIRSLVKRILPTAFFRKIEPAGHLAEAVIAQTLTGFPARKLKVIGVTGTDGKTSTVSLISAILKQNGYKVAMMTTISIDYGDGKGEHPNPTRLTTIGATELAKKLKHIKRAGAEYLVLETTSHALAQHRVVGVPFTIAVLTNINHEHLDYHGTFERYLAAKQKLFKHANRSYSGLRAAVVNGDDPNAKAFTSVVKHPLTYGIKNGDLRASQIKLSANGSQFTATIDGDEYKISCHLPGSFNVYNSMAAIGVGRLLGISEEVIEAGIANLSAVEGRMTRVNVGQPYDIIVDYAHTPESFEKIFKEVRPLTQKRLIAVFGSAGRRDEDKRAAQGEIAGKMCDIVVVTEEDDRDIDGQEILEQIASGAMKAGKHLGKDLHLVHDRAKAVRYAFELAKPGDMILLLGKGHEKSILSNGPKAAELRHLPQDDTDPRRVVKHAYDEVTAAKQTAKELARK